MPPTDLSELKVESEARRTAPALFRLAPIEILARANVCFGWERVSAQLLVAAWRDRGARGCLRKLSAATVAGLPLLIGGRRTARSVGAYFDLITDEARRFYGDSFHMGYFACGEENLARALEAHTDLVASFARIEPLADVLDVGCGIGEPALRVARRYDCRVTGVNISREQVRQGRDLVATRGLSGRVVLNHGDARALDFPEASFDAVLCMEAAGDICVREGDKERLVAELFRVLRPRGHVGFSDLALRRDPSARQNRTLRAVLYHSGSELVTDWPAIFERRGFRLLEQRDIVAETLPTWAHAQAVYDRQDAEVIGRYGRRLARRTLAHLQQISAIIAAHGTFPALSAQKP